MWYVYVIRSIESSYQYIGSTNNVKKRLDEHNRGKTKSTKPYMPLRLEAYVAVRTEAKARELGKFFTAG